MREVVRIVVVTQYGNENDSEGGREALGPFQLVMPRDADLFVQEIPAYLTKRGWMDHVLEIRQTRELCAFWWQFKVVEAEVLWFKRTYRTLEDLISMKPPRCVAFKDT